MIQYSWRWLLTAEEMGDLTFLHRREEGDWVYLCVCGDPYFGWATAITTAHTINQHTQ
jgi:hypothetical protein